MKKNLIALFLVILLNSCLDSMKSIQENIVGNISVIDSNDEAGGRFHLNFYSTKEKFNSQIVYDYIVDILGDDSRLALKCIDRMNCKEAFYVIEHDRGKTIKSVRKIDMNEYNVLSSGLTKPKYQFHTDKAKCP